MNTFCFEEYVKLVFKCRLCCKFIQGSTHEGTRGLNDRGPAKLFFILYVCAFSPSFYPNCRPFTPNYYYYYYHYYYYYTHVFSHLQIWGLPSVSSISPRQQQLFALTSQPYNFTDHTFTTTTATTASSAAAAAAMPISLTAPSHSPHPPHSPHSPHPSARSSSSSSSCSNSATTAAAAMVSPTSICEQPSKGFAPGSWLMIPTRSTRSPLPLERTNKLLFSTLLCKAA